MAKSLAAAKKTTTRPNGNPSAPEKSTEPALEKLFLDEIKDIYWAEKNW